MKKSLRKNLIKELIKDLVKEELLKDNKLHNSALNKKLGYIISDALYDLEEEGVEVYWFD